MSVSLGSSSCSSMEVDAMQVNDLVNCIEEQADEQSPSLECSDVYDVFGDPDIFPRVGEQYQVEIPPLILESDFYWFQENLHEAEGTASTLHDFRIGLPIPIIWIKDEVENNKHDPLKHACKSIDVAKKIESSKLEGNKETQKGIGYDKSNTKLEAIDSALVNKMKLGESWNCNVQQETKIGMLEEHKGKGHCLVPGSASDTWNEIEEASFILGLYIFGKNLVQVKRFIGNKKMGDILSFYYGKFYKSDRYQRWCECRKMRSRKCIYGQKIFTGPRQQELLSRLLPNASEECRSKLLKVSKTFVEGKMLLEDYVLTLKASVGLKALVEAVGVGKGKEDLTGFSIDSMKSTQALPVRSEIPVGKACSMLTPAEIISFLTGDFRLSKARSSDLFWEAVWPRLLARGWHSEQPRSYNYAVTCKHPLVFLVPGVKKFSRKLVKGNHYFDSVSDVLGKVALDPELIELETVADNNDCTSKEGNGWTKETKLDQGNSPDRPRHCYLKIKTPNRSADVMKFTVVDSSLAGEKMTKVRELRSLPVGVLEASILESDSGDEDTSEEQTHESESVNTMCIDWGKTDVTKASEPNTGRGVSSDMKAIENNPSKEELPMSSMGSTNLSAASKDQKTDLLSNTQRRDAMKSQSLQRMLSDNKNILFPVTKRRRRLTSCSRSKRNCGSANIFAVPRVKQEEASCCPDNSKSSENLTVNILVAPRVIQENASSCPDDSKSNENVTDNIFMAPRVKQEKLSCCSYNSNFSENVLSLETPPQENKVLASLPTQELRSLADPLSNSSSIISRETFPTASSSGTEDQLEKRQPRTMIDLNLPVSPEFEADEPFTTEMTEIQQNNTRKESDEFNVGTISKPVDHSGHQPDMHTRRQSTRNRPPTTKVLEAFAFGYLDRKEKRKSREYLQDGSISRPPRCRCRKVAGSSGSEAGFEKEERTNVVCNGNGSSNSNDFKSSEG